MYDVKRYEKDRTESQRGELVRIEVATTATAGTWHRYAAESRSLNGAQRGGEVGGREAHYVPPAQTDGEKSTLTWIVNDHTQLTISSTSSIGAPLRLRELHQIAKSLELRPSGRTMASEEQTFTIMATASCSTSCPSSTNMDGISTLTDDWGPDEMILRNGGTYHRGNLAGVWQGIVWADRAKLGYATNARLATNCDVDGVFGYNTYEFTRYWQTYRFSPTGTGSPMTADGVVGGTTWSYADNQLKSSGGYVIYDGIGNDLFFTRSTVASGHYTWSWNNSPYYYTGYSGIQIARSTSNCVSA